MPAQWKWKDSVIPTEGLGNGFFPLSFCRKNRKGQCHRANFVEVNWCQARTTMRKAIGNEPLFKKYVEKKLLISWNIQFFTILEYYAWNVSMWSKQYATQDEPEWKLNYCISGLRYILSLWVNLSQKVFILYNLRFHCNFCHTDHGQILNSFFFLSNAMKMIVRQNTF